MSTGDDTSRDELKRLYAAYIDLLEIGRERIIADGGTCDPVEVMEQGDPALVRVRAFLASGAAPDFDSQAADLRKATASQEQTPSEELLREGRNERGQKR